MASATVLNPDNIVSITLTANVLGCIITMTNDDRRSCDTVELGQDESFSRVGLTMCVTVKKVRPTVQVDSILAAAGR